MDRMKQKAEDIHQAGPSSILRDILREVSEAILARLPERLKMKKAIRRVSHVSLPSNPSRLADLEELPEEFQVMLQGEKFLFLDNREPRQILAFVTRRNLELLSKSLKWLSGP